MSVKKISLLLLVLCAALVLVFSMGSAQYELTIKEELGQFLYFDETLSVPPQQSCASCHDPDFGFVDPDSDIPVSAGASGELFGGRNSPASAYAMYAPIFHFDDGEGLWIGGQFWDGRATGEVLGDPLADQALGPFLNEVEMANTKAGVLQAIYNSAYYSTHFVPECGEINLGDETAVDASYDCVALAIAEFERTELFGQFTSKYDYYLQDCLAMGGDKDDCALGIGKVASKAGKKFFSNEEWYGLQLFMGENDNDGILVKGEGAMCVACHVADWTPDLGNVVVPSWSPDGQVPPLFTDFTFDNLGVPKSENPLLVDNPVDLGLGAVVMDPAENGKFKVMTLRNIGLTAPYAHNGLFTSLKEITHFYNTRDVPGSLRKGQDWPAPEYPATINVSELGNLGLSDADEDALVEFMKTLSDGWTP